MNKIALLMIALLVNTACASPENCAKLVSLSRDALRQQNFKASSEQLQAMESACPDETLKHEKKLFTDSLAKQANQLLQQGQIEPAEALLDQAKSVSWSVHSIRGNIAFQQKNWAEAAHQYHLAYDLLGDPGQVEKNQDVEKMKRWHYQVASEAQQLSGNLDVITSRDGGAQILSGGRDIGVEESIPVLFATNSYLLTSQGLESAQKLLASLRGKTGIRRIAVVGHTDERGPDDYNLVLSKHRAETVVTYLKKNGIAIELNALGKGKSAPKELSDATRYTQEEIWEINRRVELDY